MFCSVSVPNLRAPSADSVKLKPKSAYRLLGSPEEVLALVAARAADPDFKRDDDFYAGLLQTVADFVAYFDGITRECARILGARRRHRQ